MLDHKTEFEQALLMEFDPSMFDEINALVEGVKEAGGYVPRQVDEITIRKMIIAKKFKNQEIDRLKRLRDAVKAEWDKKIKAAEKEIEGMDSVIHNFIEKDNKGNKLILDVATVSLREVKHGIDVMDPEALKLYLSQRGVLHQFMMEPQLDTTAAKNYVIEEMERQINWAINPIVPPEQIDMLAVEEEPVIDESTMTPKEKKELAAKRKAEKEEAKRLEQEKKAQDALLAEQVRAQFVSTLPPELVYKPSKRTLAIRMNA